MEGNVSSTPGMARDSDTRYWPGIDAKAQRLAARPRLKTAAVVPEGHLWHCRPLDGCWTTFCGVNAVARPAPITGDAPRCVTCMECPVSRRRARTEVD